MVPVSVNWFPNRRRNYECRFCFHTNTNEFILPLEDAKRGLRVLADAGMKKLNISGGEPFLQARYIGDAFKFCKEELHVESCSVVNNGSKVTEKWLEQYGQYLDGRAENGTATTHISNVFKVAQWAKERAIKVKINTVVTINDWEEDMNNQIEQLAPFRWKVSADLEVTETLIDLIGQVSQVLLLDSENTGAETGSLRDARNLIITTEQFNAFLGQHASQTCLLPEDNDAMKDSYLNLDEKMKACLSLEARYALNMLRLGDSDAYGVHESSLGSGGHHV